MLFAFFRFLLGYVDFTVKGKFPERLLNQLGAKGISVWNMHRKGDIICASMLANDYKRMLSLRGKNRVFTRVTKRNGLPFILKSYRLRVGFGAGILLYFSLLFFLSNFVWNIEIVGAERLDSGEIMQVLSDLGVKEGVKISSIDQQALPSRLALKVDGIAWCSVNIEGVKVTVNVSESAVTDITDNTPCNLIAKHDGVITKIEVLNGTTAVSLGQTVKKGDLLVSGFTEYKDGSSKICASKGRIIAKTERELSVIAPYVIQTTNIIGKPIQRQVVSFLNLHVPLYIGHLRGEYHLKTHTERYENNGMYLPITLKTAVFTPIETVSVTLSPEEATENAQKMLKDLEIENFGDAEIISRDIICEMTDDGVILKATYICRENIAEQDLLLIY